MTAGDLLVALVAGTIIGLLGKWVVPGDRDRIPLWLTILCGIGGVLIGTFVHGLVFEQATVGMDWLRQLWRVAVAAVLVVIAAALTGRRPAG